MAKFSKISSWKLFILFIFFSGLLTACDGLQDLAVIAQQESGTNNIGGSVTAPNISTGFSNPAANLINKDVLDKARAGATATQKALDKVAEITAQERSTPEATRRVATVTPQPEVIAEQEEQIKKRIDDLHDLEDRLRERDLLPKELSLIDPKTGFPADYSAHLELDRFGNPVRRPTTVDLDGDRTSVQAIMINVGPVDDLESALKRIEEIDQRKVRGEVALGAVIINQTQEEQIPAGIYAIIGDLSLDQVFLLDQDLNRFPMRPILLTRTGESRLLNLSDGMEGSDMPTFSDAQWFSGCWCSGIWHLQFYIINPLIWIQCNP